MRALCIRTELRQHSLKICTPQVTKVGFPANKDLGEISTSVADSQIVFLDLYMGDAFTFTEGEGLAAGPLRSYGTTSFFFTPLTENTKNKLIISTS